MDAAALAVAFQGMPEGMAYVMEVDGTGPVDAALDLAAALLGIGRQELVAVPGVAAHGREGPPIRPGGWRVYQWVDRVRRGPRPKDRSRLRRTGLHTDAHLDALAARVAGKLPLATGCGSVKGVLGLAPGRMAENLE